MAASRLTFLYPHLFRTGRWSEPAVHIASRRSRGRDVTSPAPSCQHAASFITPSVGRQAPFAKRHGKAIEPLPIHAPPALDPSPSMLEPKDDVQESGKGEQGGGQPDGVEAARGIIGGGSGSSKTDLDPKTQKTPPSEESKTAEDAQGPSESPLGPESPPQPIAVGDLSTIPKGTIGPMGSVLHMGPPTAPSEPSPEGKTAYKTPPHLVPPPYVHHFDSYSLVKQLSASGYTINQSITSMKAVRGILANNLDVAQESLVSKSDVENETYLFRAACSELGTEVKNNRRVADEQLRQQRTLLQHEVDILSQRLSQELQTLNDNVRGMFNDRRMAVREEQKEVDSKIQQINYKISVMLNSDSKSEIEGLRWVLIRRSVVGIIFMAVLTLGTLRYASYLSHERQKEHERRKREREREVEQAKRHDGKQDNTSGPDAAEILSAA
ncbi:hypothetical protein B0H67DRAFT_602162 [Lasiosphaeris hirsuta]|uniref:MOZ protein represents a chromatin-associated acetyltransferase n=1 Tax=Lasiosphaeris hirsuta TaxID=260670 RepID=A0AA40DQ21_9PEZI|nr:hypothetical protein B0H67DRAFT_602162 [Lasiosphaeris hirsuta]